MQNMSVPVLALDPSSTKIGWAMLTYNQQIQYVASGVHLVPDAPQEDRAPLAGQCVTDIIRTVRQSGWNPLLVLIETPDFIASWAKPHIVYYFRAVGAIEYALAMDGVPYQTIKSSRSKDKNTKEQSKERFRLWTNRHPMTDDESDAFQMALDHLNPLVASVKHIPF